MAKITPLDIRKQEFKKGLRGYDVEEVRVFLDMVADHFEELMNENMEMREKLINLEAKVEEYVKNEQNLNEILDQTKKLQENTIQTLKQKEENIIREAELKAVEILEKARTEARQVREEILRLQEKKDAFVQRLKYLLQSYIDLIQMLGMEQVIDSTELMPDSPGLQRKAKARETERELPGRSINEIDEEQEEFIENINEIIDNIEIPEDPDRKNHQNTQNDQENQQQDDQDKDSELKEFPKWNNNLKLGE